MSKKISQYRWVDAPSSDELTSDNLIQVSFPKGAYSIGIQALPGTRFYLNEDKAHPLLIGFTGLFELNYEDEPKITEILISYDDDKSIKNKHLIIDALEEE